MSLKNLIFQLQGISLWLNQGSTIRIRWEEHTTRSLDQLHGMVIKGHGCLFSFFLSMNFRFVSRIILISQETWSLNYHRLHKRASSMKFLFERLLMVTDYRISW